jgi:hypothetical protein
MMAAQIQQDRLVCEPARVQISPYSRRLGSGNANWFTLRCNISISHMQKTKVWHAARPVTEPHFAAYLGC